jgi:hypothetical protein
MNHRFTRSVVAAVRCSLAFTVFLLAAGKSSCEVRPVVVVVVVACMNYRTTDAGGPGPISSKRTIYIYIYI